MSDLVTSVTRVVHDESVRCGKTWDIQGVHSAVRRAAEEDGHTPAETALAGIAAARDPKAKTPAALRWAAHYTHGSTKGPAGPRCILCGRPSVVHDLAESKVAPDQRHAAVWQEAA